MTSVPGLVSNRTLYVYYKVDLNQCMSSAKRIREFQAKVLQAWPGLQVQLMQRPQTKGSAQETWMEVYHHPGGVSDETIQSIQQLAAAWSLPEPRASEIFITLGHTE